MGQKVHPYGFRLGIIRESKSKWFAQGQQFREQLVEDLRARKLILERHRNAAISDVLIERAADTTTITIESAKPGIIIGRGGGDVDRLRRELDKVMTGKVRVNVEETKNPDTNAQLIAEEVAGQIERRASIRRAMTQGIERATRAGVEGIRVAVSGRLGGADIARTERVGPVGRVPLHTIRADVHFGCAEAFTTYGHIGVRVWTCTGEILPPRKDEVVTPEAVAAAPEAERAVASEAPVAEAGMPEAEAEPAVAELEEEAVPEPAEEAAPEAAETEAEEDLLAEQLAVDMDEQPAESPPADEPAETEQAAEEDAGDADA